MLKNRKCCSCGKWFPPNLTHYNLKNNRYICYECDDTSWFKPYGIDGKGYMSHGNYSPLGVRSYNFNDLPSNDLNENYLRTLCINKSVNANAHNISIGQLIIYFSYQSPVGFYHPETGALCLDNFMGRVTARHLNRINPETDDRMGIDQFGRNLEKYLKKEINKGFKLEIKHVNDYDIREAITHGEYEYV